MGRLCVECAGGVPAGWLGTAVALLLLPVVLQLRCRRGRLLRLLLWLVLLHSCSRLMLMLLLPVGLLLLSEGDL